MGAGRPGPAPADPGPGRHGHAASTPGPGGDTARLGPPPRGRTRRDRCRRRRSQRRRTRVRLPRAGWRTPCRHQPDSTPAERDTQRRTGHHPAHPATAARYLLSAVPASGRTSVRASGCATAGWCSASTNRPTAATAGRWCPERCAGGAGLPAPAIRRHHRPAAARGRLPPPLGASSRLQTRPLLDSRLPVYRRKPSVCYRE